MFASDYNNHKTERFVLLIWLLLFFPSVVSFISAGGVVPILLDTIKRFILYQNKPIILIFSLIYLIFYSLFYYFLIRIFYKKVIERSGIFRLVVYFFMLTIFVLAFFNIYGSGTMAGSGYKRSIIEYLPVKKISDYKINFCYTYAREKRWNIFKKFTCLKKAFAVKKDEDICYDAVFSSRTNFFHGSLDFNQQYCFAFFANQLKSPNICENIKDEVGQLGKSDCLERLNWKY